jgi:hypothetical protein
MLLHVSEIMCTAYSSANKGLVIIFYVLTNTNAHNIFLFPHFSSILLDVLFVVHQTPIFGTTILQFPSTPGHDTYDNTNLIFQ